MAYQNSLKSLCRVLICMTAIFWIPGAVYANGDLDTSFDPGANAGETIYAMAIQPDGKIVIGGSEIARLNMDGTLDTAFVAPSFSYGTIYTDALVLQPDGKILIGGDFYKINNISRNKIARLNADGTLDEDFNPGSGPNGTVASVALQPDGKILIGGSFYSVNGISRYGIARLNADGSVDTTFDAGRTVYYSYVYVMSLQSDGKILIGGDFTVTDKNNMNIARLNSDGSLDESFNPGYGANDEIYSIAVQPDGKILIAGYFTGFNAIPREHIARINADGSLDETFDTTSGTDRQIFSVALQSDGKILIGGKFTKFKDTDRKGIARLKSDGTPDTTFDPGSGVEDYYSSGINAIAVQSDKKILLGGYFRYFNGTSRNNIARVMSSPLISVIRSFSSSCYPVGADITVTLTAIPIAGVTEYQIEDTPPSKWTVLESTISHDGIYNSTAKKVEFGPFSDDKFRTLTYDVSFSSTETADGIFAGKAITDGVISGIATQNSLSSCVKYHPADSNKDFGLSESEVEDYSEAWKKGTIWAALPNPIPVGYLSRAAMLWKSGETYKTNLSSGNPPMCWLKNAVRQSQSSAVRTMPDVCLVGQPFTVTLTVSPGDTAIAYAVEEELPLNWGKASSTDGEFDSVNNKVKFGPFTDKEQRTLTYQVTPPNIPGDSVFKGIVSFDGANVDITGDDTLTNSGNLNADSKADLADLILALEIAAGFAESGINLNADINGDKKIGIAEAILILRQLSM